MQYLLEVRHEAQPRSDSPDPQILIAPIAIAPINSQIANLQSPDKRIGHLSIVISQSPVIAREKQVAGGFVHLAFGAFNGAIYGAAVQLDPRLRAAGGVPFGLAVWALADEALVPALGLKRPPSQNSPGLHACSCASHVIYGATTEPLRGALLRRQAGLIPALSRP